MNEGNYGRVGEPNACYDGNLRINPKNTFAVMQ
jgi:hypothetical protein